MENEFAVSSLLLSIIAVLISAWSASIAWRNSRQDKSDLRIQLDFLPESGNGSLFLATLTNHGKRSVFINQVSLKTKLIYHTGISNSPTTEPSYFNPPVELKDGGQEKYHFLLLSLGFYITSPIQIKQLIVYDTKNRKYKTPSIKSLKSTIVFFKTKIFLRYKFDNWLDKDE